MRSTIKHHTVYIFIYALSLVASIHTRAQEHPSDYYLTRSDSSKSISKEEKHSGFLRHIFRKHEIRKKDSLSRLSSKKKEPDSAGSNQAKAHISLIHAGKGEISWTSLYTQGVNLNTGISGLYNLVNARQDFEVMGIPLVVQATGVVANGQFMKGYSSYSINFNSYAFIEALRKRAQSALLNAAIGKENKLKPGAHPDIADSLKEYDAVRAKLVSPDYQAEVRRCKERLGKIEDSLAENGNKDMSKEVHYANGADSSLTKEAYQTSIDSLSSEKNKSASKDSLDKSVADTGEIHSLRKELADFEKLEKRYNELFELKKKYNSVAQYQSVENKDAKEIDKDKTSLENPDNIKNQLEENKMLKPYEKFLMGVQYFKIGRNTPEFSDFTLHNVMMNGVGIGYKYDNVYVSGGYGKQQAVINPYLISGMSMPTYKRSIGYGRIGIGPEQSSNIYATVIDISDPGSSSSLAENNWIFDLSKKYSIVRNLDIEGEVAHSIFKCLPSLADSTASHGMKSNENSFAYAFRIHGAIPKSKTDIKGEYLNTGANYITLGNQFLLSGTSTYRLDIGQALGRKLMVDIGGAHILQNQNNLTGNKGSDNWMNFGIKYKPTGSIDMELTYSPRQFQEQEGTVIANSITSHIDQLSFTGNITGHVLGDDMITSLFVGNFQYSTPESSIFLAQNVNLSYYMVNEMVILNSAGYLNFSGNESRNGWTGGLSQFIGQGTYTATIGKQATFSIGGQWLEQPGYIPNATGIIGSFGKSFGKWGKLSLQLNTRNSIGRFFDMGTAQLIVTTNAAIMW